MPEIQDKPTHPRFIDLEGERFGRLVVGRYFGRGKDGISLWQCRCDCGLNRVVHSRNLRSGNTRSCGCLRRDLLTQHGVSGTKEYQAWVGMLHRCNNSSRAQYRNYGGRGIRVSARWVGVGGLANFLADMGKAPLGTSLDREDNDGNYCPENCRWSLPVEQMRNRRCTVRITYRGKSLLLGEWAKRVGLKTSCLRGRLRGGWTAEETLETPLLRRPVGPEEAARRVLARERLRYAVKVGKIPKPAHCDHCKKKKPLQAHHFLGYTGNRAMCVKWLCSECHAIEEISGKEALTT